MYKKVYRKMRVFALCAGKNMPHERGNFSPFVSEYKKKHSQISSQVLFRFALPQGLEPWTL